MAPPLSGRDLGRHARWRARDPAQAHDLHERLRARGAGSRELLQARGRRDHRVPGRTRTAAGKSAREGRRRHRRSQRLALDIGAYRQRLSPGAARHRSPRRQGVRASPRAVGFFQGRRRVGDGAVRGGGRRCRAARRGPGRLVPEQGASGAAGQGIFRSRKRREKQGDSRRRPGLPAIHVLFPAARKTWMPATRRARRI